MKQVFIVYPNLMEYDKKCFSSYELAIAYVLMNLMPIVRFNREFDTDYFYNDKGKVWSIESYEIHDSLAEE